jgi:E3 ubiquitin-protein ligase DOA10
MIQLVIGLTACYLLYKMVTPSDCGKSKVEKALDTIKQKQVVNKLKKKLRKEQDKLKEEE